MHIGIIVVNTNIDAVEALAMLPRLQQYNGNIFFQQFNDKEEKVTKGETKDEDEEEWSEVEEKAEGRSRGQQKGGGGGREKLGGKLSLGLKILIWIESVEKKRL